MLVNKKYVDGVLITKDYAGVSVNIENIRWTILPHQGFWEWKILTPISIKATCRKRLRGSENLYIYFSTGRNFYTSITAFPFIYKGWNFYTSISFNPACRKRLRGLENLYIYFSTSRNFYTSIAVNLFIYKGLRLFDVFFFQSSLRLFLNQRRNSHLEFLYIY